MVTGSCAYCGITNNLTNHHLIPTAYRKKSNIYLHNKTVVLCFDHHAITHKLFSNAELAEIHNTADKLMAKLEREEVNHKIMFGHLPDWSKTRMAEEEIKSKVIG